MENSDMTLSGDEGRQIIDRLLPLNELRAKIWLGLLENKKTFRDALIFRPVNIASYDGDVVASWECEMQPDAGRVDLDLIPARQRHGIYGMIKNTASIDLEAADYSGIGFDVAIQNGNYFTPCDGNGCPDPTRDLLSADDPIIKDCYDEGNCPYSILDPDTTTASGFDDFRSLIRALRTAIKRLTRKELRIHEMPILILMAKYDDKDCGNPIPSPNSFIYIQGRSNDASTITADSATRKLTGLALQSQK